MIDPKFTEYCETLRKDIISTYESGTSLDEAEKLAAKFLDAQMQVAERLRVTDLDSRMRKTGVKAIKGTLFHEAATKGEKKPSDSLLQAMVDKDELVIGEQERFDEAEADRDYLQNMYNVFRESHIYFRGVGRGRFE